MKRASIGFLFVFFTIVILLTYYFSIKRIKLEEGMEINFVVERVELTPALRAVLYDKNNKKLRLQRFVFFERHKIQSGDYIVKEKGAKYLIVYRNDSIGNKRVYLKMYIN